MLFLVAWPGGSWEAAVTLAGTLAALYVTCMWAAVAFWTARDVHQRTRSGGVQFGAVVMVLAFFLPGLWLYLILRPRHTLAERYERSLEAEAVLLEIAERSNCPACARRVRDDYLVCPSCRAELKVPCVECARPLNHAWIACPGCGRDREPKLAPVPQSAANTPVANRPAVNRPLAGGANPFVAKPRAQSASAVAKPQALSGGAPGA